MERKAVPAVSGHGLSCPLAWTVAVLGKEIMTPPCLQRTPWKGHTLRVTKANSEMVELFFKSVWRHLPRGLK